MSHPPSDPPPPTPIRGLHPDDAESIRPVIRWRLWLPIAGAIATVVGSLVAANAIATRRQRDRLLADHASLTAGLAPPYAALRGRIETLVAGAAKPWQGTYVEPGFRLATLAHAPVLYGRVRLPEVHSPSDVPASIRHHYADQVVPCMGLEVARVHDVYSRGDFLMPAYVDSIAATDAERRLEALRADLEFRLRRDTAAIVAWTATRYLAVAMDEAALSIDGPTRLYVWDLRDGHVVLRARATGSEAVIVPVNILGLPGSRARPGGATAALTLTQHDCALANEARTLLGAAPSELDHPPPDAVPAAHDGGAAAAHDASQP